MNNGRLGCNSGSSCRYVCDICDGKNKGDAAVRHLKRLETLESTVRGSSTLRKVSRGGWGTGQRRRIKPQEVPVRVRRNCPDGMSETFETGGGWRKFRFASVMQGRFGRIELCSWRCKCGVAPLAGSALELEVTAADRENFQEQTRVTNSWGHRANHWRGR
jgi:hypothetical protein